ITLIPTMGALHKGHIQLIEKAREIQAQICVSIFVNPAQFGKGEDLETYPRPLEQDLKLLQAQKVDAVFIPKAKEMDFLPTPERIHTHALYQQLCGKSRPVFFAGVANIIYKFAKYLRPDLMVFGLKDYQQCIVVKQLLQREQLTTQLQFCPLIRTSAGLALSSRNTYMNDAQLVRAERLFQSLLLCRDLFVNEGHHLQKCLQRSQDHLNQDSGIEIEYFEARQFNNLDLVNEDTLYSKHTRFIVCAAIVLDGLRLIDNIPLNASATYWNIATSQMTSDQDSGIHPPYRKETNDDRY
ncbi:MAG: pantoate--beta-alanine ligase, partial [Zetaproteobacteria bacterium]|nr:pantoate--beta-alanine ligase [Zetaproteobacteria bacterium]